MGKSFLIRNGTRSRVGGMVDTRDKHNREGEGEGRQR